VETQHGSLRVDSEVGTGSTFTVTLPRANEAPPVAASAP
jgi:signal transduction histidine kinase